MKIKEIVVEGAFDNLKNLGKNFKAGAAGMPKQAGRDTKGRYTKAGRVASAAHGLGQGYGQHTYAGAGQYASDIGDTIRNNTALKLGSSFTPATDVKVTGTPVGYVYKGPHDTWTKTNKGYVNSKGQRANQEQTDFIEKDYQRTHSAQKRATTSKPIDDVTGKPTKQKQAQPQQKTQQPSQQAKPEKQPTIGGIGPDDPRYADLAAKMKNARPTPKQN